MTRPRLLDLLIFLLAVAGVVLTPPALGEAAPTLALLWLAALALLAADGRGRE